MIFFGKFLYEVFPVFPIQKWNFIDIRCNHLKEIKIMKRMIELYTLYDNYWTIHDCLSVQKFYDIEIGLDYRVRHIESWPMPIYLGQTKPFRFNPLILCLGLIGSKDLYAIQASPPPLRFWCTPWNRFFFDVSDDLEQKEKKNFLVQKIFWTCKIFGYFDLYAIQAPSLLNFGPPPDIDFFDVSDDL